MLNSFHNDEKQEIVHQKFEEENSYFTQKIYKGLDNSQQDEENNRLYEEFSIQYFEKTVMKNRQIQKIIQEAFEQSEKIMLNLLLSINTRQYKTRQISKQPNDVHKQYQQKQSVTQLFQDPKSEKIEPPPFQSSPKHEYKGSKMVRRKNTMRQESEYHTQENQMNSTYYVTKPYFQKINAIMENLEEPQEELDKQKQDYEIFMQSQEESKALIKNHGKKLRTLLDKWCENEEFRIVFEDPKLEKFQHETWGDLIDFEKKLKEEMQKQQVYAERLRHFTISSIDWIKYKTGDYIECLEIALNEQKLQSQLQTERLMMSVEDHESRAFNVLNDNDFLKSALEIEKEIKDSKDITNF